MTSSCLALWFHYKYVFSYSPSHVEPLLLNYILLQIYFPETNLRRLIKRCTFLHTAANIPKRRVLVELLFVSIYLMDSYLLLFFFWVPSTVGAVLSFRKPTSQIFKWSLFQVTLIVKETLFLISVTNRT